MFTAVLSWVQTHILYFLYQAANAPENGLITLLSGSGVDLTHLHRFNREFWSLLQIVPEGMTTNPYHGTMVASMSIFPDLTYLPPTGRFEAMLESLLLNPLLHLCYVIYVCTVLSFMLWSSERRSGLYAGLSLTTHKVTKLIKILPASMMIKLLTDLLSPTIIYDGAIMLLANFQRAYTPTDSHPWAYHPSPSSAAHSSVPNSIIPIILVVILILTVRYLKDLQAVTTSQRAEIQILKSKLKASESDNEQLRSQAQYDLSVREEGQNRSRKLTTMLTGALLMLQMSGESFFKLVERHNTEASNADASTTRLQKANADLLDSVEEKNARIAEMSTKVDKLIHTKAEDDSTIASVRGENADLCDRINTYADTNGTLRAEVDGLTNDKKELAGRAAIAERSSEAKSQRLFTLAKEAVEKDDKIKGLGDRVTALETASAPKQASSSTQSQNPPRSSNQSQNPPRPSNRPQNNPPRSSNRPLNSPPAPSGNPAISAWGNFAVDDAVREAKLRQEAADQAAEDAKNGITHEPVAPTLNTSFKQVTFGPDGERIVRSAVKEGTDTTGTASSGADAEASGSATSSGPPPAAPLPSSTTPSVTGPSNASIADRAQPATPKTPTASPSTAAAKRVLCKNFQIDGFCRFGDKCRYAHATGPVIDKSADKAQAETQGTPANIAQKDILCPYFFQTGHCRFKKKCRFAHVVTDTTVYSGGLNRSGHVPSPAKAKNPEKARK